MKKNGSNTAFLLGAFVIIAVILVALLGSFVRPDSSPNASQQHPSLARLRPFSTIEFLKVRMNKPSSNLGLMDRVVHGGVENDFAFYPYDSFALENQSIVLFSSGKKKSFHFADVRFAIDPFTLSSIQKSSSDHISFIDIENESISITAKELKQKVLENSFVPKTFVLGTDALGRDMLSRLMAGSSVSLSVGLFSVFFSLLIGLLVGLFAGYFGGPVDRFLSWSMNLFWSIPAILLVVAVTMALGSGVNALIVGISLVLWVEMAQVIRYTVQSIRSKDFIKALRLMGLSHLTILFRHVLPNVFGPIAVLASSSFADAILLEAGLSFLGIGVVPPKPSWGNMIRDSYGYIIAGDSAFLALIPSLALIILVLAFVFVSNGLRRFSEVDFDQSGRSTV